jgi:predicted nucleic acid-binding protein
MHTPAHFDAEVLSGLCRLHRAGAMTEGQVERCLRDAAIAPIERHSIVSVMEAAWALRHNVRLADALYIALGVQMGMPVLTLDTGMASSSAIVELLDP